MFFCPICVFLVVVEIFLRKLAVSQRRHDIHHIAIQHNDTQHKGIKCDTEHKLQSAYDAQHNNALH
jgi:hypothetical protein